MQSDFAVITMVRDDDSFLQKWVAYYGGLFGRRALYVVNHGDEAAVNEIAAGCNIIAIPNDHHRNFDMRRWRLFNHLQNGLRAYFNHIIVGDVDEFVVADPQVGTVPEIVRKAGKVDVITPFGLEVLHLTDREPDAPNPHILGPRRFVQVQPHYAKPCIVRNPTKLSRGGHFADSDTLAMPDGLYLLHMKYCDAALYADTMNRRNATVSNIRASEGQRIMIGRHWFPEARKDDATFQGFQARPQVDGFDFSQHKAAMQASWQPRETTGFYQFDRPDPQEVYTLPERFFGIL